MPRPPLRLGKLGVLLAALLGAGLMFIGGSALVDVLFIREPSEARITAGIRARIPETYRSFDLARTELDASIPTSGEIQARRASFSPKNVLFKAADFEEAAIKLGDDPAAFADAVARRKKLDSRSAPPLPADQALKNLYSVVPFSEASFTVEVLFRAEKVDRHWPLRACWHIWRGIRQWNFPEVNWPKLPQAAATLRERHDLGFNSAVLGEQDTEARIRTYVDRRAAFIKAVLDRENRSVDQVIQDSVRQWVAQSLKPSEAYVVKTVTPLRPPTTPAGSNVPAVTEASLVIEQQAELFRPGKPEDLRAAMAPHHDRLEQAKKLASEFLSGANLTVPTAPAIYDSASPAGSSWTGTVAFEVRTSGPAPIENIRWRKEPIWPVGPLVSLRETEPNAAFQSTDAKLRTVAHFQAEVEQFIKRVDQAIAGLESRWGKDRDAWRMALGALAAHGGRERIRQQAAFIEEIIGTRFNADDKEYPLKGTRKTIMPFRVREDLGFTGERVVGAQTETLNDRGFWRTADGVMGTSDLTLERSVTFQRRLAFTRHILWHLAAESTEKQTLIRGSEASTLTVSSGQPEFPDVVITLDPKTGLVTSTRFEDPKAPVTKIVETRYSQFQTFAGTVRPTKVAVYYDGKPKEAYTVTAWKEAPEIKPGDFRNPYSPGTPFRGNPNGSKHIVEVTNTAMVGTPVMICFDDDPDTVVLASRANRAMQLQEGDHAVTIVAWIPQLSLRQSHRIETTKALITIKRPGKLIVSVDRTWNPPIRWEFR